MNAATEPRCPHGSIDRECVDCVRADLTASIFHFQEACLEERRIVAREQAARKVDAEEIVRLKAELERARAAKDSAVCQADHFLQEKLRAEAAVSAIAGRLGSSLKSLSDTLEVRDALLRDVDALHAKVVKLQKEGMG